MYLLFIWVAHLTMNLARIVPNIEHIQLLLVRFIRPDGLVAVLGRLLNSLKLKLLPELKLLPRAI